MTVWGFGIAHAPELEQAGRRTFEQLCKLLSDAIGVRFRPIIATSYRELAAAVESGEAGVAWLPPIPAIELDARGLTTALAIPARNGKTTYHSALVVRRGGPRAIADLKGRRAVWVERDSASAYIVPRMHLAGLGFDVLHFFARELFVHSHAGVIDAIVGGEADVGATYCHVEARDERRSERPGTAASSGDAPSRVVRGGWMDDDGRPNRPIEVLATFGPIPNDALVASNELSATARSSLARWLLDPPPVARELFGRLLGSSDFRVPSPAHYDPLKHMLRTARARGQDAMPSSSRTGIRVSRR